MIKFLLAILLTLTPCFGQGMILNPYRFSAASGTLTLDTIATPAFAAYSVSRKLRSAYAGSAFRIRLASDGSEFDIGFDGSGNLNKTYLESTAAGTDAFIKIIYDQSGNGRDATQSNTAKQPKIVSAGTCLLGSNSRAAATFDGTDDYLISTALTISQPAMFFGVVSPVTTVSGDVMYSGGNSVDLATKQQTGNVIRLSSGTSGTSANAYTLGTWYVFQSSFNTTGALRINGGSLESVGSIGSNGGVNMVIGDATLPANFKFSEMIVYNSVLGTTDESTIRTDINSFYTLY